MLWTLPVPIIHQKFFLAYANLVKSQGVAILDKLDYIAKMGKILSDKTAFMQANRDDNVSNLGKFQNFLRKHYFEI